MSIRIESRENSLVKRLVRLSNDRKFRKEMQEMVCEGEKSVSYTHLTLPTKLEV